MVPQAPAVAADRLANLPYPNDGLMTADQPWSGSYGVGESTWATAQVTQFTAPGWQFLHSGSGYLGGRESNGSYVSLKSANGSDYSTIIESTTATSAQTVNVKGSPAPSTLALPYRDNFNSDAVGSEAKYLSDAGRFRGPALR